LPALQRPLVAEKLLVQGSTIHSRDWGTSKGTALGIGSFRCNETRTSERALLVLDSPPVARDGMEWNRSSAPASEVARSASRDALPAAMSLPGRLQPLQPQETRADARYAQLSPPRSGCTS